MKYTKRRKLRKTRKNRKQRKTRKARGGKENTNVLPSQYVSYENPLLVSTKPGVFETSNETIPSVASKILFTISRVPLDTNESIQSEPSFESNGPKYEIFSQEEKALLNEIDEAIGKEQDTDNPSVELLEKLTKLNNLFNSKKTDRETIEAKIKTKIVEFNETPPVPKESDRQIWFMEIPEVSNTSSQPKGGNDPQPMTFDGLKRKYNVNSIHEIVSRMTEELVNEKDTFTANIRIDNNRIATITDSGKSASIQNVGQGSNNVLYNSSIFIDYADTTKYILRISIRAESWESTDILKNYIYETCYGVLAADNEIGPKVYDYGIFQSANSQGWYFYSMIERINGCDIFEFVYKNPASGNIPASSYCDSNNYKSEDTIGKFNEIINTSIDKLNKAGTNCGLLLMDSKPNNIMMTKDATKVYVIDYDKNYMLDRPTSQDEYDMYGKINVILFLSNAYYWIIENIMQNDLRVAFGKYIFEKLQSEYYNHEKFKDIQTYIQTLYFGNPDFIQLCHHYSYTERGLLKIRYFTEYILSFDQMDRYAGDNILFFQMTNPNPSPCISYRYPIALNSTSDSGIEIAYMDVDTKPATVIKRLTETYKTKYEMIKVYSLNRLCITKANSQPYIPFDQYTATQGGIRIYNHIAGCSSKYEEYINQTLIPEFKKTYYMNTDNARIKAIVDSISIDNAVEWVKAVESKLRAQDSTSNQPKTTMLPFTTKKPAIYDVLNNTYIENISLEAVKYRRALVYAFDKNYRSQDNSIAPNVKLIYRTSSIMNNQEDKDKHIVFFDTEVGICSGQVGTIAQLQQILNEKLVGITVSL